MADKLKFRNDMKEAKPVRDPEGSAVKKKLSDEKGTSGVKHKLKGADPGGDKLRHGKKPIEKPKESGKLKSTIMSQQLHQKITQADEDDNIGVESANRGTQAAETGADVVKGTAKKVKKYGNKLHDRPVKAEVGAEKETLRHVEDEVTDGVKTARTAKSAGAKAETAKDAGQSNVLSRFLQRKNIKQEYAAARSGRAASQAAEKAVGTTTIKEKAQQIIHSAGNFIKSHAGGIAIGGAFIFLLVFLFTQMSSCSSMAGGSGGTLLGSSYTAEDADIRGANRDYTALETALRNEVNNIETTHPGYDEYRYNLAEINHNPYVLTSYLTVKYEDYTRAEVQSELHALFDEQYELTLEEEVEIRTRTETQTGTRTVVDPDTGDSYEEEYEEDVEVEYEYHILNVTLQNKTLEAAVFARGMTDDQIERYMILNETKGNRPYLFEDDIYANPISPSDYLDYDIPGEALSDIRFARMIQEAEKYLGYPYVWGGSSPSTSFDCSGFVCWVINHCGNGWNYGRTTAEGLRQRLTIIPPSEAKPGDIIFFQGTYNTYGASHVAIYVGNGMMIHCGNPIQYASINTSYWQAHFYCFGRLP